MEKAIGPGPNYPFREAVAPTPGLTILAYPVTGMVAETTMRWNKSSPETRHGSGPALASELFTGDSYHGQYETGPNQPRRVDWLSIKRTRLNDVPLAAQHHAFMRRDTRPNQRGTPDWLQGKRDTDWLVPSADRQGQFPSAELFASKQRGCASSSLRSPLRRFCFWSVFSVREHLVSSMHGAS